MASASSDRVEVARAEIAGFASTGHVHTIEPYTFERWADMTDSSESYIAGELREYANMQRSMRVQPYTFERWARHLR